MLCDSVLLPTSMMPDLFLLAVLYTYSHSIALAASIVLWTYLVVREARHSEN
jgi:hypothetical protein